MRKIRYFVFPALVLWASASAAQTGSGLPEREVKPRPAWALFEKLIRVPRQATVLQTSSHNKMGVNSDAEWPLYKDGRGDDVIFDASGPGCVKSMWGTAFDPRAVLQFYFDGEKEPRLRIPILDFYQGKHPLFPPPLVSYERRGKWGDAPFAGNSFVPVPFARHLKISVEGEARFFHVIYEKYPYPAAIETFTGREDRSALRDAFARLGEAPFEAPAPAPFDLETKNVEPGATVSLLKLENRAGIVREIVLEADGGEDFFRETRLRMRWDGHALWDVEAPPGLLFGSAARGDDVRTLPLRVEKLAGGKVRLSCWFPMPFWEKAEIEWANTTGRPMAPLAARISVGANAVPRDEGAYFTTVHREGRTTYGRDWPLFDGRGTGWFVGAVQSMMHAHYCEGNEHFAVDGAVSPRLNGTGTEDYYLACFWPNTDFDTPFGSVAGDIQEEGGGDILGAYHVPSSYSRFHLEAPIPFFSSFDAAIQHGGRSDIASDYRSLGFGYLRSVARLRQTDALDVGNLESEAMHGYRASDGAPVAELVAFPEGEFFESALQGDGRYHRGGDIRFRAAIAPRNNGVRLRRRIDQKAPRQAADVYVDGRYAGCWFDGYGNEFLRWADSDFELAPAFTRGKKSLEIRLEVVTGGGESPFSDFGYTVFCYEPLSSGPPHSEK